MLRIKHMSILGLAVILLGNCVPMQVNAALGGAKSDAPEGMVKVAESDELILYLDEEETDVAVRDKSTGKLWFSNPQDANEDTFATAYYQKVLKSQLQIQYYNENVQSSTMDNYNDCIKDKQFSIEYLDNGITITYTLGAAKGSLLLPDAISEERMQQFMANMTDKQKKKLHRNYTLEAGMYTLRGGVKDYLKEELAEYFAEAGYTQADYEVDMATGVGEGEEDEKPWFTIPLTYRLDEDNLVVSIDPNAVSYNENGYYLVDIDVLPYFAAAKEEEGYLFVPDGSGALIHLDNGKNNISSYKAAVFGQDKAQQMLSYYKSEINENLTIKMPVYGIKAGEQALFAIIENGAGYADISADVSGKTTSYNNVYAGFSYLQYGPTALSDMVGANGYQLYAEKNFADSFAIRYAFLSDEAANYSGMAAYYRDYLVEKGVLVREEKEKELPFYTEYIGAVDKYKTLLGVKYKAVQPLTTFAQASEISKTLKENGIDNQTVVFSGWMNGGLHGTANTKVDVEASLGKGGMKLEKYLDEMSVQEIGTYMTVDMQYVYQDKLMDGYSTLQYAPGYFDHSTIEVGSYYTVDGYYKKPLANLISPHFALQVSEKIAKQTSKYDITGLHLGTATWDLYSDYLEDRYTDRQAAIQLYQQSFRSLQESGKSLLGDNGNAYSLEFVDDMINVPLSSQGYMIFDEEVPFYEMVLHGYMDYAGEAWNMSDDYETTLLKSVECGAGVHFQWIYGDNSLLKETEYDYLYAVHYKNWMSHAIEDYTRMNTELGELQNQIITAHERVQEDLVKVTYEDGTCVYVNYGKEDALYDGVTIPARDYIVRKGSE